MRKRHSGTNACQSKGTIEAWAIQCIHLHRAVTAISAYMRVCDVSFVAQYCGLVLRFRIVQTRQLRTELACRLQAPRPRPRPRISVGDGVERGRGVTGSGLTQLRRGAGDGALPSSSITASRFGNGGISLTFLRRIPSLRDHAGWDQIGIARAIP